MLQKKNHPYSFFKGGDFYAHFSDIHTIFLFFFIKNTYIFNIKRQKKEVRI